MVGEGDQVVAPGGILPPIKIAKPSGKVTVPEDMSCVGLWIAKGNTADLSACKQLRFGGSYAKGLINEGTLIGTPGVTCADGVYNGVLAPGAAKLASLTVNTGNCAYGVLIPHDLTVTGDVACKTGSINLENNLLTVGGSLRMPAFAATGQTFMFVVGKDGRIAFNTPSEAVLDAGDTRVDWNYSTSLPNVVVDKPGGVLRLQSKVVVNGALNVKAGTVAMDRGAEVWLGVKRDGGRIVDVPVKLASDITPETSPPIAGNDVGPAIPAKIKLVNIAPFADIRTVPYTTMVRMLVDRDPQLRTCATAEAGTPTKAARCEFRFPKPQSIAAVRWCVPNGKWVVLADTTGDGAYDKVLRMDLTGKIANPGGVWLSRAWVNNNFWPPVKAYGVKIVNPDDAMYLFDVQILTPADAVTLDLSPPKLEANVPLAEAGEALTVADPPAAKQFVKGYHIETWMLGLESWLSMKPHPALSDYEGFKKFVAEMKRTHANYVNLWPPRSCAK